MSIETDIQQLTKAINGLTDTLIVTLKTSLNNVQASTDNSDIIDSAYVAEESVLKAKTKKAKVEKLPEPEVDEFDDEFEAPKPDYSLEKVKNFAKEVMATGVAKEEVKKEIAKLGADTITDLQGEALMKLYKKLETMKKVS